MSNLRDAIVHMALRRPYLYLLVTLVISIVLMEVLVEICLLYTSDAADE